MDKIQAADILALSAKTYASSDKPLSEACQLGRSAIMRQLPERPYPDGDCHIEACSRCGSGEYLHNTDGNQNRFCGQCGQAIEWEM